MELIIIVILTIIIIAALLTMLYITLYNKLQYSNRRIEEAEKVIAQELKTRYTLIKSSKKYVEKNTKMDLDMYSKLDKIKKSNISSYDFEKKLTETITTIYIINNDYPKLADKKEFKDIIRKLEESDTRLNAAKSFYNNNNEILISQIKKFPSNIVATINGIRIQPYYEAVEIFNEKDDGIKI